MKLEEIKQLAGNILRQTRVFVEAGQSVCPTAFRFQNGGLDIVGMPMDSPESKVFVQGMIAAMSKEPGVDGILFINDAWILDVKNEDDATLNYAIEHGVGEHPDRTEALSLAITVGGRVVSTGLQPYTRTKPIHWETLKWRETD